MKTDKISSLRNPHLLLPQSGPIIAMKEILDHAACSNFLEELISGPFNNP